MANDKQRRSFHCHQCGLLMMLVRFPEAHAGFYKDNRRHLLTWQCPLCHHVLDQYVRTRSIKDKLNPLGPLIGPETRFALHA